MKLRKIAVILVFLVFTIHSSTAQFTILSEFGNLTECDTMSRGIFLVWWDNMQDLSTEADVMLDSMIVYRSCCLEELWMEDPPNPMDGYFYNVYLHQGGDIFPDGWAMGQGTDVNGYPFLTMPVGAQTNYTNLSHETFHIFQYSSNAPGFSYSGDSQWYIEASANWFAGFRYPMLDYAFVEAESLVKVPHVPLWLSFDNFPSYYPQNWQRYVHQYALGLLLYYLTEIEGIERTLITSGFFSGANELPQEYLFNHLGADAFREYFLNWASRMTNDFDFLTPGQKAVNEQEWNTYADPWDDKEFVRVFDDAGTGGWYRPPDSLVTAAWAFNTYKILNASQAVYSFHLSGDYFGSQGSPTWYGAKVMVRNTFSGTAFYNLDMINGHEGSVSIGVSPADEEIFLIVASMPAVFSGVDELYSYEINIDKEIPSNIIETHGAGQPAEIARYNLAGQKIDAGFRGIQIIRYSDGTTKTVLPRN